MKETCVYAYSSQMKLGYYGQYNLGGRTQEDFLRGMVIVNLNKVKSTLTISNKLEL